MSTSNLKEFKKYIVGHGCQSTRLRNLIMWDEKFLKSYQERKAQNT